MDLAFLFVISGVLWVQSWYLLGFIANPRTLGLMSVAVAIILVTIVLFQDQIPISPQYSPPMAEFITVGSALSVFVLAWAVYAAVVAAVYLWGLETRTLGFYSLFLWVVSILFAVYFFAGGEVLGKDGGTFTISWLLGVVAVLLAILSALMGFYLALRAPGLAEPLSSPMRTVTGWFYLVFSITIPVLGGLLLLGIEP